MSNSKEEALSSAKESGKKILDWWKDIGKWVRKVTKWTWKSLAFALKGWYHLIDAWDKAIWEKIEKKQKQKWKKTSGKLKSFARNNIIKTLIATSVLTHGGIEVNQKIQDRNQNQKEVVIEEWSYFKNPDFFNSEFELTKDLCYANEWIELVRDAWMSFYVVQQWDNLSSIRLKLSKIPEFSYLADSLYKIPDKVRNINSFNVPAKDLKAWMLVPIPVREEDRQVEIEQFKKYCKISLEEMKNNEYYGSQIKKILDKHSEKDVIDVMTAFARSETSQDYTEFSDFIWSVELHRREESFKAFSFSYYHILMEYNADHKTMGPGLKARMNLWLTEWQCYHPVNAWKLFLWYCCEKKKKDPWFFFKIDNLESAKSIGKVYNGSKDYGNKLWANVNYIRWQ